MQVRAGGLSHPPEPPSGRVFRKAAGGGGDIKRLRAIRTGKRKGGRTTPLATSSSWTKSSHRPIDVTKVRAGLPAWTGLKFAAALPVRDSRARKARNVLLGGRRRSGCRGVTPASWPRDTPRGTGEEGGPFEGAVVQPHTHPDPTAVPTHGPSPPSPAAARGSTSSERGPRRPFFNKTTIRTAPRTRTGRDPGLRPCSDQPRPGQSAPRARAADGRRDPAACGRGGRASPGSAARLCPTPPLSAEQPGVPGGARTARGAPALTACAPGSNAA